MEIGWNREDVLHSLLRLFYSYDFDLFPGCDVQIDTKYLEQQKWLRQGPVSRLV